MELLDVIKNRRSIRRYHSKEIPEGMINKLIEALIWAPSAGNLQSRKFYFIFDDKVKKELARETQDFIVEAPLVVVACTNNEIEWRYGQRGKSLYAICDVAMSVQNMMLLAHEMGLGSCPVGAFDEGKVSKILNMPKNLRPILIVPIGYPAERPLAPSRVSKEEAVGFLK